MFIAIKSDASVIWWRHRNDNQSVRHLRIISQSLTVYGRIRNCSYTVKYQLPFKKPLAHSLSPRLWQTALWFQVEVTRKTGTLLRRDPLPVMDRKWVTATAIFALMAPHSVFYHLRPFNTVTVLFWVAPADFIQLGDRLRTKKGYLDQVRLSLGPDSAPLRNRII